MKKVLTWLSSRWNPDCAPWYVMLAWAGLGVMFLAIGLGLIAMILKMWYIALN